MSQVFHILRKDVRRLWIELTLTFVAFVYFTLSQWSLALPTRNPRWYNEAAPVILLVLCWLFLVERLVHGEVLVGDRQFWVTRPYVWYKLLLSKIVFIALFIAAPLFASDCILLGLAHVPIGALTPWLVSSIGAFLLVLLVPAIALAAITRSLPQWLIFVVVAIAVIIGLAMLDSYIPNANVPTGSDNWEELQAIALLLFAGAAVVVQYARRERWLSSTLTVVGALTVPVLMLATPYRAIIERRYQPTGQPPFNIQFVPKTHPVDAQKELPLVEKTVSIRIPLHVSDFPPDVLLETRGVMLQLDGEDGQTWRSDWQTFYNDVMYYARDFNIELKVPREKYERTKTIPTSAQLVLAFDEFHDANRQAVVLGKQFDVKGVGRCWLSASENNISCRTTQLTPTHLLLTVTPPTMPCKERSDGNVQERRVARLLNSDSTTEPMSPFAIRTFNLNWTYDRDTFAPLVCPGSPITFSTPTLARSFRYSMPLGSIRLADYSLVPFMFSIER